MNAKEMFEELGYEVFYGNFIIDVLCKIEINDNNFVIIEFAYGGYRINELKNGEFFIRRISKELHNAIHQQMKELGWLDE